MFAITLVAGSLAAGIAVAQQPAAPPSQAAEDTKPNDYGNMKSWLCHPGRPAGEKDACDVDESATVVAANGTLTKESWKSNPNASVDCFYAETFWNGPPPIMPNPPGPAIGIVALPEPSELTLAVTTH